MTPALALDPRRPRLLDRLARGALLRRLDRLSWGRVTVSDPLGRSVHGPGAGGPETTVLVHDPAFYSTIAARSVLGAAESYMRGEWTTDDLTGLVRTFVRNRAVMDAMERGPAQLAAPALRVLHALRRNTVGGARRNIHAHYDLGNDFFALFLDPTLSYSCATFERDDMTLEEASHAKNDRLCRKLRLRPTDHLLEIGTGWGGLAIHAARHYGCRVTTTTISAAQHEAATARVRAAGLADRVTVLREDYRNLRGRYDKLVSVEMIEAVGAEYHDTYFARCSELLAPDGMMALQAIVIDDRLYDDARRSVDFIKRYIFPGGCLPSVGAIAAAVGRASDLRLTHQEDLTPHYATTLAHWRRRFLAAADRVRALGFDDAFLRRWEWYFCYCEGGFLERNIGVVQQVLEKPLCRVEPLLPSLAA